MSSFKRKGKQALPSYSGTRVSPASNLSLITSTGISSLDDILGGGLPLSCSLVFAAPDIHSSYGELIEKYFVAQGLAVGHSICVVSEDPDGFMRDVMWFAKGQNTRNGNDSEEEYKSADQTQKVKIAWRYEKMKQFQTTTGDSDADSFCQVFELSSRVPEDLIEEALQIKRLHFVKVGSEDVSTAQILGKISSYIKTETSRPMRICIPGLGSAGWGDLGPQSVLHFLHSLRAILRRNAHGCASISLAPQLSTERWGGAGWMEKVGWASDGTMIVSGFSGR
ncbi:Elongator complex protein 4 [Gymnopilus junonius]|uniref:Elongator complex protein 4 n=1 Tax=Gymnopilus junonius TaxID=109634 RepID=A0A9P5NXJ3_GYMJU|nr:Elongator complex protein 4 [Gymnopilus junonius]